MLLGTLITLGLVVLNGFFVAAEFAIVKVRASRLELKIASGGRVARVAKHISENLNEYLSGTQLGITLSSLALGWIGQDVVTSMTSDLFESLGFNISHSLIHSIAIPIAFIVITILHIVFGELAPKWIAIRYPEPITFAVAIPLNIFYKVFRPFIWSLNRLATLLLKVLGISVAKGDQTHTEEELRLLLSQSRRSGEILPGAHELIEQVFKFDDRIVKQIMVPRRKVFGIDISSPPDIVLNALIREEYSRVPAYKDSLGNILGIIHVKDVLTQLHHSSTINLQEILFPAYFVPETKKISELLKELQTKKIHVAIAVDEFGEMTGLVTLEDIVEELVGEIQDEYDEEIPAVERKTESEFVVRGGATIIDVNRLIPVPLPEGSEYDTISGLVNLIFGLIPEVNQRRNFGSYEFTILRRSKQRVEQVLLKLLPRAP